MRLTRRARRGMMVGMRDFLIEPASAEGERILARPDRFLVPIAQFPDHSFIIPNSTVIVIMEYRPGPRDRHRARAWQLGHALCCAGVPVFDKGEKIRIYCPCTGSVAIFSALQFYAECVSTDAQELRSYAEFGDYDAIARIVGEVSYKLDNNTIIIDGAKRPDAVPFRTFTQRYMLPEGATLL